MVGGIVELMGNDSVTEAFNKEFDTQVNEDAIYDSYFSSDFLARGYPYKIINQSNIMIGDSGKSNQTYIYLDYINY